MSSIPVIYRRKLRRRIIELIKASELFKAVYDSRVTQLDPNADNFPCAIVYANVDDNSVEYQRATHNVIRESSIDLKIQIVNHVTSIDDWPGSVELLESQLIAFLKAVDSERKIDDCIKWFTLASSRMSIDVEGEEPEASVSLTYAVDYNETIVYPAKDDFLSVKYDFDVDGKHDVTGEFDVR